MAYCCVYECVCVFVCICRDFIVAKNFWKDRNPEKSQLTSWTFFLLFFFFFLLHLLPSSSLPTLNFFFLSKTTFLFNFPLISSLNIIIQRHKMPIQCFVAPICIHNIRFVVCNQSLVFSYLIWYRLTCNSYPYEKKRVCTSTYWEKYMIMLDPYSHEASTNI